MEEIQIPILPIEKQRAIGDFWQKSVELYKLKRKLDELELTQAKGILVERDKRRKMEMAVKKTTFEDIKNALWAGANTFRDNIDASNYKDYVLSMLFVKYLSGLLFV